MKRKTQQHLLALKDEFFTQYATGFLDSCYHYLKRGLDGFISPKFAQHCFRYIFYAFQVESVAQGLASKLDMFLFDLCTPMLAMNQKDEENWNVEPGSFLYAQDCRLDGHNLVKYASKDLIDQILRLVDDHQIPMFCKVLEFTKTCFEKQLNVRTGEPLTLAFKECLMALMIHCHKRLTFESENVVFEADKIVEVYLSRELFNENKLIMARACNLLTCYGATTIHNPESIMVICKGLETALSSDHLAVRTSALIALNRCTVNDKVSAYFETHLAVVFDLVVTCMRSVDYKELVYAAEGLIKDFGNKVLPFSTNLLHHFNKCFYEYLQHSKVDPDETDDEDEDLDDESELEANVIYESIYAAEACLEAILSLLQLNLQPDDRQNANNMTLCMIADVILETNNELLIKSLSLLNFILYKETQLNDAMKFFYPVLCYILLDRPNTELLQSASLLPESFYKVLSDIDLPSLSENVIANSLGCFLNYIAKMGAEFYASNDYYGIPFVDLLFNMMVKIIREALTGPSDTDIIFMLRIVIGLLENGKNRIDSSKLGQFLDMVLNLTEVGRTDTLKENILQTVSMFIWFSPTDAIEYLRRNEKLEEFYKVLFQAMGSFTDEKAKERTIYGLVALLELPPDQAKVDHIKQSMNLGLIMTGIVKSAQELTELRIEAENPKKEKPGEEIDISKANKEFEDDDSDEDFDDADEEVWTYNVA